MRKHLLPLIATDGDGAVGAVYVTLEIQIRLHLQKVREDLSEGPLFVTSGHPVIVVLGEAAEDDLTIDGAGTASDLPTRDGDGLRLLWSRSPHIAPGMGTKGGLQEIVPSLEVVRQAVELWIIGSRL
jgi:hypothetical protein